MEKKSPSTLKSNEGSNPSAPSPASWGFLYGVVDTLYNRDILRSVAHSPFPLSAHQLTRRIMNRLLTFIPAITTLPTYAELLAMALAEAESQGVLTPDNHLFQSALCNTAQLPSASFLTEILIFPGTLDPQGWFRIFRAEKMSCGGLTWLPGLLHASQRFNNQYPSSIALLA